MDGGNEEDTTGVVPLLGEEVEETVVKDVVVVVVEAMEAITPDRGLMRMMRGTL